MPCNGALLKFLLIMSGLSIAKLYRSIIISLAHEMPMSGHLGVNKTYHKIPNHWSGLKADVANYAGLVILVRW